MADQDSQPTAIEATATSRKPKGGNHTPTSPAKSTNLLAKNEEPYRTTPYLSTFRRSFFRKKNAPGGAMLKANARHRKPPGQITTLTASMDVTNSKSDEKARDGDRIRACGNLTCSPDRNEPFGRPPLQALGCAPDGNTKGPARAARLAFGFRLLRRKSRREAAPRDLDEGPF